MNWIDESNAADIAATAGKLGAFDLLEPGEAALLVDLPPGQYTAFAGDAIHEQAFESGFQTCLTKPVEPLHLVTTLAALAPKTRVA